MGGDKGHSIHLLGLDQRRKPQLGAHGETGRTKSSNEAKRGPALRVKVTPHLLFLLLHLFHFFPLTVFFPATPRRYLQSKQVRFDTSHSGAGTEGKNKPAAATKTGNSA